LYILQQHSFLQAAWTTIITAVNSSSKSGNKSKGAQALAAEG
jgi:hypothetical protein